MNLQLFEEEKPAYRGKQWLSRTVEKLNLLMSFCQFWQKYRLVHKLYDHPEYSGILS